MNTGEAGRARARVAIYALVTGTAVQARAGGTLVDLVLAVIARETARARASVAIYSLVTGTTVQARQRSASGLADNQGVRTLSTSLGGYHDAKHGVGATIRVVL